MNYCRIIGLAFAVMLTAIPASASPSPKAAITAVWDLDEIYPTPAAWTNERTAVERRLVELRRLNNRKPDSAMKLRHLLDAVSDARGRAAKMAKVGTLQHLTATNSEPAQRRQQEGVALESRVDKEVAFVDPLLRSIGAPTLTRWLNQDRVLARHRRRIIRALRLAPYSPPASMDEVPPLLARWSGSMSDVYGGLADSDLNWPTIDLASGPERIEPGSFAAMMRSADSAGRAKVADAYFGHLSRYKELFGLLLTRRIEADLQAARLRNLDNSVDNWLVANDAVEPRSYRAMFAGVRSGREQLRMAATAMARLQGVDRARYTDLYANPVSSPGRYPLEEMVSPLLSAVAPLGADYRQLLEKRLAQNWLHLEQSPNKSSTVGVFWQVGGGHPHGLLTYRGDLASTRTLGGAAVLMMGYASVPDELAPDRRQEDLPIYSNAIWYLGFQLMDRALLATNNLSATEKQQVRTLQLTGLLRSYVRSAMLTELESRIGERIAAGDAVTGEDISRIYRTLLEEIFGSAGFLVDDHLAHEWMTFPTLFEGPHYATFALSAATAVRLEDDVLAGKALVIQAVKDGIGRSETHFSEDIIRGIGIDVGSPALYAAANARVGELAEQILRQPAQ